MIIEELVAVLGWETRGENELRRFNRQIGDARRGLTVFQSAVAGFAGGLAAGAFASLTAQVQEFMRAIGPGAIIRTGASFEQMRVQLTSLEGSAEKAEKSFRWIRDFAVRTPLELEDVIQSFMRLRIGGMDPMDGTLQALVDTASAFGSSGSDMNAIIVQLGQAWQKTKLQMQDIRPLIDRGIPVWEVLAEVTGKTTAEVIAMSEAGKIGRQEMTLMIQELGRRYAGAGEKMSKTFIGIMSNLSDMRTEFLNMAADAGFFDVIKDKAEEFLETFRRMERDGSLKKLATQISDFLVSSLQAAERGLRAMGNVAWLGVRAVDGLHDAIAKLTGSGGLATLGMVGAGTAVLGGKRLLGWLAARFPIVAAFLVLEDLAVHMQGGESVIGDMLKTIDDAGNALKLLGGVDSDEVNQTLKALAGVNIGATDRGALDKVRGFWTWLADQFKGGVKASFTQHITASLNTLIGLTKAWHDPLGAVQSVLQSIKDTAASIVNPFGLFSEGEIEAGTGNRSKSKWGLFVDDLKTKFFDLFIWLLGQWDDLFTWLGGKKDEWLASFKQKWEDIFSIGGSAAERFFSWMMGKVKAATGALFDDPGEPGEPENERLQPGDTLRGGRSRDGVAGNAGMDRLERDRNAGIAGRIWNGTPDVMKPSGMRSGDPGAPENQRLQPGDTLPGGRSRRSGTVPTGGGSAAPGTYRPQYPLSEADLSDAVVNTIAGEVSTRDQAGVDAVINNMLNRVGTKGYGPSDNLREVARAPGQYEGYRRANQKEAEFIRSRIRAIASGSEPDITDGAMEFRADWYVNGRGRGKTFDRRPGGINIGGNVYKRTGVSPGPYEAYPEPRHAGPAFERSGRGNPDVAARSSATADPVGVPAWRQAIEPGTGNVASVANTITQGDRVGGPMTLNAPVTINNPKGDVVPKKVESAIASAWDRARAAQRSTDIANQYPVPDGPVIREAAQ